MSVRALKLCSNGSNFRVGLRSVVWSALLIAIVLPIHSRIVSLGSKSLWRDEFAQYSCYERPLKELISCAANHFQPPLDYLIGRVLFILNLATSDFAVRTPALIFGIGSLALFFFWLRQFAGLWPALVATALLSWNPLHFDLSQQARPYTIFFFFFLLCSLQIIRYRKNPTKANWFLMSGSLLLMLMSRGDGPLLVTLILLLYSISMFLIAYFWGEQQVLKEERIKCSRTISAIISSLTLFSSVPFLILDKGNSHFINKAPAFNLAEVFQNVVTHWQTFLSQAFPNAPVLFWCAIVFGALGGIYLSIKQKDESRRFFVFVNLFFAILYSVILNLFSKNLGGGAARYLALVTFGIAGCAALALDTASHIFNSRLKNREVNLLWASYLLLVPLLFPGSEVLKSVWAKRMYVENHGWRGANRMAESFGDARSSLFLGVRYGLVHWTPPFYGPDFYIDPSIKGTSLRKFNAKLLKEGLQNYTSYYISIFPEHIGDYFNTNLEELARVGLKPYVFFGEEGPIMFRLKGPPGEGRETLLTFFKQLTSLKGNKWPEVFYSVAILHYLGKEYVEANEALTKAFSECENEEQLNRLQELTRDFPLKRHLPSTS